MGKPRKNHKPAVGIGIAALVAALCFVALAADSARIEKPAAVDVEQYADFIENEVFDIQDLAEGAEIQRRRFNRMTPPGFSWVQPMFPAVVPFDAANFDDKFLDELLGEEKNSVAIYPLSLALDPKTRETLVYNADGKLIAAIPADRIFRDWPEDADPSRVTLQLDLLPSEDVEPYLYTESRIADYVEFQSAKATKSGGMVLRSLGASEFGIAGIQRLTNGNTQITVTNGAEVAEVYSYTVWHTSTMTTNEWVDEYGVTNISTNTLWTPVSPPFNGIDSEWECLTTNLVLSGGVGVYEDANSSSNARVRFYAVANRLDTDGDGLSDGAEICIHRTDPDNPDSDGDGVGDGVEIAMGSNPLDMASFPAMTELDEALGLVNVAQLGYLGYLAGVTFSYDSSTNYAQRIQQLRDMLEGLAGLFLDLDVNTGGVLAERPDVATWSLGTVLASTGNSSGQWLGGLASTAQVEEIGAVLGKLSRLVNEGSRQSGHAHQPIALHTGVVQVGSAWNLGTGYPERWPTNQPIQTYLLLDTKVDIPYVGPGTVDDWIDVNGSARFPDAGYIFTNHVADISPVWEPEGTNTLELWDCGDCAGENNYAYLSPFTLVQVLEVPILKVELKQVSFSGDKYHAITSDDGSETYTAPHWVDNSNPINGSVDDPGDVKRPVAFTRNTKPKIEEAKWHVEPPGLNASFKIKGQGQAGISFPSTAGTLSGNELAITDVESAAAFANEIGFFDPLEISWQFSINNGATWCDAGTSDNQVYVTLGDPETTLYHTVVHIGCKNAAGENDPGETVTKIWGEFTDLEVQRVSDGHTLIYYKTPFDPECPFDVAGLLSGGDGRCGAWARFFRDGVKAQGIAGAEVKQIVITPQSGLTPHRLWVKNQDLSPISATPPSSPVPLPGVAGQGTDDPSRSVFIDHAVVTYGTTIYDPSYGASFTGLGAWQKVSLDAISYNSGAVFSANSGLLWPLLVHFDIVEP